MYAHLAAHLPISKDTLMKRARKLVTEKLDDRVRQPLNDLREGSIKFIHKKNVSVGLTLVINVRAQNYTYFVQIVL